MEEKETKKLTYEQLEQVAMQLQKQLMMEQNKLKSIDFASMRLTWLFRIIENKSIFSEEYINKCAEEIKNILTIDDVETTPPVENTETETEKA